MASANAVLNESALNAHKKGPHRKTLARALDKLFFSDEAPREINEIIGDGWLDERSPLQFGPRSGCALGISAERLCISWVLANPRGVFDCGRVNLALARVRASGEESMVSPETFRATLTEALETMHRRHPELRLGGAAVAWPTAIGLNGEPTHYKNHHPAFAKSGFSLRDTVRAAIADAGCTFVQDGGEIAVINDADADLLYETRWGVAKGVRHAIGVKLCGGVGSAVLVDGRLLRGHRGHAGEIEHVPVRFEEVTTKSSWARKKVKSLDDLDACWCGGEACIERFASGRAIIDTLGDYAQADDYNQRGKVIQADSGEKSVQEVFERAGQLLGMALVGPVLALDPQCVIVTAFPTNKALQKGVEQNLPDHIGALLATPGGWTTAAGAARLAVEESILPRIEQAILAHTAHRWDLPAWLRQLVEQEDDILEGESLRYSPGAPH
jgi:predicted NBD/HSP70 family sugar kinase